MPVAPSATKHRGIHPGFPDVREAPAASPWQSTAIGRPVPDDRPEPVLAMAGIQGNVVAGFNKSYQTLLHYHIEKTDLFKPILAELSYLVATADEVLAFNRLFKQMRDRRGQPSILRSCWINIAFSFRGLKRLGAQGADLFADRCFRSGLVEHCEVLKDPTGPDKWKVNDGDGEDAADVLIIVAADTEADLAGDVQKVRDLIRWENGARQVGEDQGQNLPGELAGHEHFGFLDGISQLGIRGRASDVPSDLLTPRLNPIDRDQGKPGQDLNWPGEFVFGYPDQDGSRNGDERGGDSSIDRAGYPLVPKWARDGSYQVFRRLRQEVPQFHAFLHARKEPGAMAQAFAARFVGRWPSGAPSWARAATTARRWETAIAPTTTAPT
jgi:deferrochelatase/peroxidase EfeB